MSMSTYLRSSRTICGNRMMVRGEKKSKVVATPVVAPAKPGAKVDPKAATAKPGAKVDPKAATAKPGAAKPGDTKAGAAKPGDAKVAEVKPVDDDDDDYKPVKKIRRGPKPERKRVFVGNKELILLTPEDDELTPDKVEGEGEGEGEGEVKVEGTEIEDKPLTGFKKKEKKEKKEKKKKGGDYKKDEEDDGWDYYSGATGYRKVRKEKNKDTASDQIKKHTQRQDEWAHYASVLNPTIRPPERASEEYFEARRMYEMFNTNMMKEDRMFHKNENMRIKLKFLALDELPPDLRTHALVNDTTPLPHNFIIPRFEPPLEGENIFGQSQLPGYKLIATDQGSAPYPYKPPKYY